MYGWFNFRDKVKKLFSFNKNEIEDIIILSLMIGLLFGFNKWGYGNQVDLNMGLFNMINYSLMGLLSILIHLVFQKFYALKLGLKLEYSLWKPGILISLLLIFISNGSWIVFFPSAIFIEFLHGHRIGYFRYDLNLYTTAYLAFSGLLGNIFLGFLAKYIYSITNNMLFLELMKINFYFAIMSLIPFDAILTLFSREYVLKDVKKEKHRLDGTLMFFGSRKLYFFAIGFVIGCVLLRDLSIFGWILLSIFLGLISMFSYMRLVDKEI